MRARGLRIARTLRALVHPHGHKHASAAALWDGIIYQVPSIRLLNLVEIIKLPSFKTKGTMLIQNRDVGFSSPDLAYTRRPSHEIFPYAGQSQVQ